MKPKGATHNNLLYPHTCIKDREAYLFYKKNYSSHKRNKITRQSDWTKIVDECWKEIGTQITESRGGVFIPKLGYFAIWMSPLKAKQEAFHHTKGKVTMYNDHTDNHVYHPTLFTNLERGDKLKLWNMDREFNQVLTRRMAKELRAGKRYVIKCRLIKKLYKQKKTFKL